MIALGVWTILGVVGMQFFNGKMYRCSDAQIQYRFPGEVKTVYGDPLNSWDPGCNGIDDDGNERSWGNYDLSFDDILQGVRTMFLLTTMDNWPGHMVEMMDARSKHEIPVYDFDFLSWFWGIVFLFVSILVCGSVVINMVVGTFVDCYNMNVQSVGRSESPPVRKLVKPLYEDPVAGFQGHVWRVISTTKFDMFIAFFIVANVVAMAVESYKKSDGQIQFDLISNYFFTYVFGMECLLKFYTLRMKRFFENGWNKFDFFIVMISFFGVVIDNLGDSVQIDPTILRILRIFRIFRILRAFRIFKALKSLQELVKTIAKSLPSMANLVAFLLLFFFIWSVLGVVLYGAMCKEGDEDLEPVLRSTRCLLTNPDMLLPVQAHFQNVEWILITLFRVSTGDAWGDVMTSLQLASGWRGTVDPSIWEYYGGLTGQSQTELESLFEGQKKSLAATDKLLAGQPPATQTRWLMAKMALTKWNASKTGLEDEDAADGWAAAARLALPECISDDEAVWLESNKLMDCRVEYPEGSGEYYDMGCGSNCGGMNQMWLAVVYMGIFAVMSFVILLQLVIAVLMDQFTQAGGEETEKLPECAELDKMTFLRMRRRWRNNAVAKLKALDRWDEEKHNYEVRSVVSRSTAKSASAVAPAPEPEIERRPSGPASGGEVVDRRPS